MSIEMKLELGHRASVRDKPTPEGFTHDWLVFVKGAEGTDINHFVEKVVFHLHESFPKPRRVVKEPPYQVSESGYAGFIMPIEVYFRSKEEPKKVRFEYDLFLRLEGSPVYNIRREKLTFQNPSEDFRRKLLIARGVGSGATANNNATTLQTQTSTAAPPHIEETSRSSYPHAKQTPAPEKKIKSHSTAKESAKKVSSSASGSKDSQKFADTFGSSPNANAHRSRKAKENHSSSSKASKNLPPPSGPPANATPKEPKSVPKSNHSPEIKESKSKSAKSEKEPKSATKRPHPSESQNHHGSTEKKRRYHSNSDVSEKHTDNNKVKETKEKKEKHKNKVSNHGNKKEKHKASHSHSSNKEHSTKSPPKSVNNIKASPSSRLSNDEDEDDNSCDAKAYAKQDKSDSSPASDLVNAADTWCEISPEKADSTIDKNMISPMSPDTKHSPVHVPEKLKPNSNHIIEDSLEEKPRKLIKSEKSPKPKNAQKPKKPSTPSNDCNSNSINHNNVKQNGTIKEHTIPIPSKSTKSEKETKSPQDYTYIRGLIELQQKIMALEDRNLLQKVVDVIQETGCYQMTTKSFDFDLCSLDQGTVHKLKQCLYNDKSL